MGRQSDGLSTWRSKYTSLRAYLYELSEPVVRMSFVEIERIVGMPLPRSARQYVEWWANESARTHVQAAAWLDVTRSTRKFNLRTCGDRNRGRATNHLISSHPWRWRTVPGEPSHRDDGRTSLISTWVTGCPRRRRRRSGQEGGCRARDTGHVLHCWRVSSEVQASGCARY